MNCSQNSLHTVASQWHEELVNNVLPFWQAAIDEIHGGVFTCFNNEGSSLLSHDKFTWSQGRFLWNWCRQAYLIQQGQLAGNANEYLAHAKLTAEFLDNHVFLENGHCSFVLTEQGDKKEQVPGAGFDTSFYADCFVVMGFCEYAYVAGEASYFEKAMTLYQSIRARLNSGKVRSEPYPAAEGFEPYAFEMITLGVNNELLRYAIKYQHPQLAALKAACQTSLERIFNDFHDSDSLIPFEMRTAKENHTTLLAQHVTPGHTLENMWFCVEAASLLGQLPDYLPKIVTITKMMWTLGWDKEYLGLYRYTSRQGTQPNGDLLGNDPYENLVLDTWDTKIWWVHSEALYTLLLTYKLSGDEALFSMYEQTAHYVLSTFPNAEFGEWTQIRDRQGKPLDKVVALPVKDPFHIMRNLQLMVSLFASESQIEKEVQC
ncbi:AGE family epimerase/isomerase [Vibrio scophthalmi]|uniref:N-acylglucosamine 2-epimerase n=1 Tax=Vibrio scophthalmi TaxID=45658 RepID=A0A1E3WIX9_9VIBR|nr:AGE family epimerase/isomerase [Vibrio scophthalmi]ODS05502.1 N-acylglucosamine 2-epimerase [Vibrio scophthalmi]